MRQHDALDYYEIMMSAHDSAVREWAYRKLLEEWGRMSEKFGSIPYSSTPTNWPRLTQPCEEFVNFARQQMSDLARKNELPEGALSGSLTKNGWILISNKYLLIPKDVPARPHRRKRIAKKWLKKYGTKSETVPDTKIYLNHANQTALGHPAAIQRFVQNMGMEMEIIGKVLKYESMRRL